MAKLSTAEVTRHAAAAGFQGADLRMAVAVAFAESGGNPNARNLSSREDSRGLWQINVRAHPEFASSNLYDPATNARAARAVLRKQGWRAWSVYTNGRAALLLPGVTAAIAQMDLGNAIAGTIVDQSNEGGVINTAVETGSAIVSVGELAAKAGTWINNPRNWMRVIYVMLGGALVIGALVVVAAPVATNVVPAGKVLKTAKKLAG
jgi:hypothetical protein